MLSKCLGTGNRHQPFFGCCPRGVRNWKQACPIFSELPAWSSAWSSPQSWGDNRIEGGNPGVTTGLKEAILEFFPGNPFARTPMPGRRGRASMPGSWGLAAIGKKKRAGGLEFFSGKNPDLGAGSNAGQARPGFYARRGRHQAEPSQSPGPLLYVLYVLYLTRQATEHPLSPGSLLYVLYVLYLTRQPAEHPFSPGSLLYVLYVLYLTRQATEHPLSRVPCYMCYMCYMALYSTYTTNFCAYRVYSTYSTYSKDPGESGGSAAWRVRYSTYSTYSKDPGKSGGSAAWRVRYSTYSTYSKDPGESEGSASMPGRWRGRGGYAGQVA